MKPELKVRLVHEQGGPERIADAYVSGGNMFVVFSEFAGTYRVDLKTGRLLGSKRRNPWSVHEDDLKAHSPVAKFPQVSFRHRTKVR